MSKVLLTGASGRLGTHLRQWFAAHGRGFVATDIIQPGDGTCVEIVDLADREALDRVMADDISAVVHFGGMAKESVWQTVLDANIIGTYNVFEAARKAGVGRVIYASSYHVVGMYPSGEVPLGVDAPVRPDTLYGLSKVFGENVGRLYADKFGVGCLAIRICAANSPNNGRDCRLWCHRDDLARLVDAGLDAPDLGYKTVFAISDNDGAWYRNDDAQTLGWRPQHSSRELGLAYVDDPLDANDPRHALQGGAFAIWPHFDDEKLDI
jgi:uronate dehydrogenase